MGKGVVVEIPEELQDDVIQMKEDQKIQKELDKDFEERIVKPEEADKEQERPKFDEAGVWRREYKGKIYVSQDGGITWFEEMKPPTVKEHVKANWERGRIKIFKSGMKAVLSLLSFAATLIVIFTGELDPVRILIATTLSGIGIGFLSDAIQTISGLELEEQKEKLQNEVNEIREEKDQLKEDFQSEKDELRAVIDKLNKKLFRLKMASRLQEAKLLMEKQHSVDKLGDVEKTSVWRIRALIGEIISIVDEVSKQDNIEFDPNYKARLYEVANIKPVEYGEPKSV